MVATESTDYLLCLTYHLWGFFSVNSVKVVCLFLLYGLMYLKINSLFPPAHTKTSVLHYHQGFKSQTVCVGMQSTSLIMFMLFADFSVKPKNTGRSTS